MTSYFCVYSFAFDSMDNPPPIFAMFPVNNSIDPSHKRSSPTKKISNIVAVALIDELIA